MKQRGFTLVELIIAITMMGIISVVTVSYIKSSVQGYADLKRRDQLASSARVAVERMAREIRNALPNSIRVNVAGSCIEFIPTLAASRYESIPTALSAASASFDSIPFARQPETLGRIAVYPIDSNRNDENLLNGDDIGRLSSVNPVYDNDSWSIISPIISATSLAASSGVVTVNFSSGVHAFPADSPSRRYFIVDDPVSFCVVNNDLYRFQGDSYGLSVTQPTSTALMALNEPNRRLLASDIVANPADSQPFNFTSSELQRNGLVLFDLFIQNQKVTVADPVQESIRLQYEVQVRNVP